MAALRTMLLLLLITTGLLAFARAVETEGTVTAAAFRALEQRLATLESTCGGGGAAGGNDIAARLDAQDRAMGRASARYRAQFGEIEIAMNKQQQWQNDTQAVLEGLSAVPSLLTGLREELVQVSARLTEHTNELGQVAATSAEASSAVNAAAVQVMALEQTQGAQAEAVDALTGKVAALEQGNHAASVSELEAKVQQLAKVQEEAISAVAALRDRLGQISVDVATNARATAANADAKAKEVEHRVVFVPADTQEPQLKQHQRVRAT